MEGRGENEDGSRIGKGKGGGEEREGWRKRGRRGR